MAKPISKIKFIFPVIRKDKEGIRYFILKGKRIIIPKKLTKAELKRFIIKERAKAEKIRIVRKIKRKPVVQLAPVTSPPLSHAAKEAKALEAADIEEKIKKRQLEERLKHEEREITEKNITDLRKTLNDEKILLQDELDINLAEEKEREDLKLKEAPFLEKNIKDVKKMLLQNKKDQGRIIILRQTFDNKEQIKLFNSIFTNADSRIDELNELINLRIKDIEEDSDSESDEGEEEDEEEEEEEEDERKKIEDEDKFLGFGKGMNNLEIDEIMRPYKKNYLGTVPFDRIELLLRKDIPKKGGFICNTQNSSQDGRHWVGIFYDKTKGEINYYDSLANPIPNNIMKELQKLALKMKPDNTFLKFKENQIVQKQDDHSTTCGWFSIKFLIDRFRGQSFSKASGFDDIRIDDSERGENMIKNFRTQNGFGYISGEGLISGIKKTFKRIGKVIRNPRKLVKAVTAIKLPEKPGVNVKSFLETNGDSIIQEIRIYRDPISTMIQSLLNVATLGGIQTRMKQLGFDRLYHLYGIMRLSNGKYFKFEKNARVTVSQVNGFNDKAFINVHVNANLLNFWENGEKAQGKSFYKYDSIDNNCQVHIKTLLKSNGLWNQNLEDFVMQPVNELIKDFPGFQRIAKGLTDVVAIGEQVEETVDGDGTRQRKIICKRRIKR